MIKDKYFIIISPSVKDNYQDTFKYFLQAYEC